MWLENAREICEARERDAPMILIDLFMLLVVCCCFLTRNKTKEMSHSLGLRGTSFLYAVVPIVASNREYCTSHLLPRGWNIFICSKMISI